MSKASNYVDKSLFIKRVLEASYDFFLITRPRRWGKTLNLIMLKLFLEIEVDEKGVEMYEHAKDNYKYFENLLILKR